MYCSPYNASSVLMIDIDERLRLIDGAGSGDCKWTGIAAGLDGRLYCVPSRASTVLVVHPGKRSLADFSGIQRGNAKWSGLCVGLDQRLYCTPYNSSHVLGIKG